MVILCGLLAVAVHALRPSVQREFVLAKLSPVVQSLSIESVRATPWSLHLRGVEVGYKGGRFHLGKVDLGFNPLALFDRTVSVRSLYVRHTDLDLSRFVSTPSSTPFVGILSSLNHGYGLALNNVDIAASVQLAGAGNVSARIQGGGIKPHVTGHLNLDVVYGSSSSERFAAKGEISFSQLSRGRFREVAARVDARLRLQASQKPLENLRVDIAVRPPPGLQGNLFRTIRAGTQAPRVLANPEAVSLAMNFGDDETNPGFALGANGFYRPDTGVISLRYKVSSRLSGLETALGVGDLPEVSGATRGVLQLDSVAVQGLLTLESKQRVSKFARPSTTTEVPEAFVINASGQGSFDRNTFMLSDFDLTAGLTTESPQLAASLAAPLAVNFAQPLDLLKTPRALAKISVINIPLGWFSGVVPDTRIQGELNGRYSVAVDAEGRFKLDASAPTTLANLTIERGAALKLNALNLTVRPSASWSTEFVRFALNELTLLAGADELATLTVKVANPKLVEPRGMWRYRAQGGINFDAVRALLPEQLVAYPLPAGLKLNFKALIAQRGQAVSIEKIEALVAAPDRPELIRANGVPAFHFQLGKGTPKLGNPTGSLAAVAVRGIDLAWASPFLRDQEIAGQLEAADFVVSAPTKGSLKIEAERPVRLSDFSLRVAGKPVVDDLDVAMTPTLMIAGANISATYAALDVRSGATRLISGNGEVKLGVQSDFATRGKVSLDLGALAKQPAIAKMLSSLPAISITANLEFDVQRTGELITVTSAQGISTLGERAKISFEAEPGLELRSVLKPGENLARHVVGAVAVDIENLSSAVVDKFFPLGNISFSEINSNLRVKSDGGELRAASLAPLAIDDIKITDGSKLLLNPFAVSTSGKLTVTQQEIRINLEDLALRFAGRDAQPAITGAIKTYLSPDRAVPITKLETRLTADLPQLLAQPAVMPGHKLSTGALSLALKVNAERKIEASIVLDQLSASAPLAISTFELPITGEVATDGRGFDFTAPLIGRGKSGPTSATVIGHYSPQPDEPRVLNLDIDSEVFYLNDILASVSAISKTVPSEAKAGGDLPQVKAKLNEAADAKAVWKLIPYAVVIDLAIEKLFYTDYVAFTKVAGQMNLRRRKYELSGWRAFFHDSAITFDGVTRFEVAKPDPYALELTGRIVDFNFNQFFSELVPGEKPRVEGLFSVDIKAFGEFPNFSQLRNRVLFDITMRSREGLFRPLPPESSLMLGASDVLGIVGEGLSYVPTGGFGAGAVARLVNYIGEIDYDTIDIHLERDASKDVKVTEFLVLSPTIALTATGGIKHTLGVDILDSPLALEAHLDMLGRGAAILYSMDLMQDDKNEFGYWRGPEFRIWGSAAAPQSNFAEVVKKAGDGTLKGAITRPISGLIGNLKYRWFNDNSTAKEAAKRARRMSKDASEQSNSAPLAPVP